MFPVAVTTETSGMGSAVRCCLVLLIRLLAAPLPPSPCVAACGVGGWVGCGPYSGRFAVSCCLSLTPTHRLVVDRVGGVVCVGRLVPVSSRPLPVFHFWPINPVVCWGPTKKDESFLWRPCLEDGFPLRCFQRLPVPNVANQPCPGRDNWHTRGSSVPVLSY